MATKKRRKRSDGVRHKKAFLAAYAKTGNVYKAAEAAGVLRGKHYVWLKRDKEYAEAYEVAHATATGELIDEARRRAVEGLKRFKFDKNGEPIKHPTTGEPYYEHVYSDLLLMFITKQADPSFRENVTHRHKHSGHVTHEVSTTEAVRGRIDDMLERRRGIDADADANAPFVSRN